MRRIIFTILTTISGLVLLMSYRTSTEVVSPVALGDSTGTGTTTTDTTTDSSSSSTTTDSTSSSSSTDATTTDTSTTDTSSSTMTTSSSGLADGTYTGDAISTRYGPVQVQITVSGGQIVTATATDYPYNDRRDQQINDYAIPILESETVSVQSANISMISGATYTSVGYAKSLQSAIDEASA